MELLIGVVIGLVGICLTFYYGVRSKKYEEYFQAYHQLDIQKRQLLERIELLRKSNQQKDVEISSLHYRIREIDRLSDSIHEGTFDPRKLKWSAKCPKCGDTMCLDDVDYWYHCHKCGYETDGLKDIA